MKERKPKRERGRQEDTAHLALIRKLPCIITGEIGQVDAAHIRFSNAEFGKVNPGAAKPDDRWTIPLSHKMHTDASDAQHRAGEELWWAERGIKPLRIAERLYDLSEGLRSIGRPEDEIVRVMTAVV
ncbi:MAG: hypothetical protein ABII76_18565, partial [Pseudomonadota bacterium]